MPHATVEKLVVCCAKECVQPGVELVPFVDSMSSTLVELEFCVYHVERMNRMASV